ncbi:hypothetical protein MKW98_024779 [Papaver atlanticum]|uniref:Uncharacterized protein n=1 Tax=Papaver atlanticum TaxID=357466 RepID=A0AAD4XPI5_9MAGN|nr:hypothetical protein MKW98_024779 [Papaver atlanticum]
MVFLSFGSRRYHIVVQYKISLLARIGPRDDRSRVSTGSAATSNIIAVSREHDRQQCIAEITEMIHVGRVEDVPKKIKFTEN